MKKTKNIFSNTLIRNSVIWAAVMIISYLFLGDAYKKFNLILLGGFLIELSRNNTLKTKLNKSNKKKE